LREGFVVQNILFAVALWPFAILGGAFPAAAATLLLAVAADAAELRLLSLCVLGAIGGAATGLFLFLPHRTTAINAARRCLLKLAAAFGCGVWVTPAVLHDVDHAVSANYAIGLSLTFSFTAIAFLHFLAPFVETWFRSTHGDDTR
jgi:hypothetical protein